MGTMHVQPVARLLKTYGAAGHLSMDETDGKGGRKVSQGPGSVNKTKKKQSFNLDYVKLSQMRY